MDNTTFIQHINKHLESGHKHFPANTPQLLSRLRSAISENTANAEQQSQLVALEAALSALAPSSPPSFPGSSAKSC